MKSYKNFSLVTEYSVDAFSTEIHERYALITYMDNTKRKIVIKKGIAKGNKRKIEKIIKSYDDAADFIMGIVEMCGR
jgi:hypothetical protein